jgi:hypothetical protein
MPRQVRIQYLGAMYHVMSRGNRRQEIYSDDVDPQDFRKTLAHASRPRGFPNLPKLDGSGAGRLIATC